MSRPIFSFLLPARGRIHWLKDSISSIFKTAADVSNVEVLLGMDNDDVDTIDGIKEFCMEAGYSSVRLCLFERLGYQNLHLYMNSLAEDAQGDYLITWNDDATLETVGWDQILRSAIENQSKLNVYQFQNNHCANIFSAFPKKWYSVLGHISLSAPYDSWLSEVSNALDVSVQINIRAFHYRGVKGNEQMPEYNITDYTKACLIGHRHYYSDEMLKLRQKDIFTLGNALYADD